MLFKVINDTGRRAPYCGPCATSALTGAPITRVEKMIRRVRDDAFKEHYGRKRRWKRKPIIRSTGTHEVKTVLERLGCKVERYNTALTTFGQFVDDTQHMPGAFLVEVTGHWIAVSGGHYADSANFDKTALEGADRRRLVNVWRVFAPVEPRFPTGIVKQVRPKKTGGPTPQQKRAQTLLVQMREWEKRKKRAETALKKLRPKLRRYEKLGVLA